MKSVNSRRPRRAGAVARRHLLGLGTAAALCAWLLGCGADDPTGLGGDDRVHPDSLQLAEIKVVTADSVFHIAGTLGRSPTAQIGREFAYTSHVLLAFKVPAFLLETVDGAVDTLRAEDFRLTFQTDSLSAQPFTGVMRLGLREVTSGFRGWTRSALLDSVVLLPPVEPDALAPDTLVAGAGLLNHAGRFTFALDENRIAGWDTIATPGDSVELNVAVQLLSFATAGRGFLEFPFRDASDVSRFQLNGFHPDRSTAVVTGVPVRVRDVVEFDSSYNPGTKVVVSDGHRLHTYLKFKDLRLVDPATLRPAVPESALIHLAELILTQVDTTAGTSFGTAQQIGAVVPTDTTKVFTDSTAARGLAFTATLLAPVPGAQVAINITPYVFDQQEGQVPNRGIILRLSNEGTKARHFEFYGSAAPDSSVRPRLRILYSLPARFEGGRR